MIQRLMSSITKDGLMLFIGIAVVIYFGFALYASVFIKVANPEVVQLLTGQLSTLAAGIVTYYWGSSKSSADKTKIMADKGQES